MDKAKPFFPFSGVSKKAWLEKIEQDLKGKDPKEVLEWDVEQGLRTGAVFHGDDLTGMQLGETGASPKWKRSETFHKNATAKEIEQALFRGIDEITLDSEADLEAQLNNIDTQMIEVHFKAVDGAAACQKLVDWPGKRLKAGSIVHDPLNTALQNGKWPLQKSGADGLAELNLRAWQQGLDDIRRSFPEFALLTIDQENVQNAGATATYQVALLFAAMNEYLSRLSKDQQKQVLSKTQIRTAVSTDYFLEIAKLRAIRLLWNAFAKCYGVKDPVQPKIRCTTSRSNYTIFDRYNNMIRATTQGMSAVIGGCDSLEVLPFDLHLNGGSAFGQRIARNLHHLFVEESHFDKVDDPAAGSYFLENLTNKVADKAWQEFKDIEAEGGFVKLMESNAIQNRVEQNASETLKKVKEAEKVVLGVNKYFDGNESRPEVTTVSQRVAGETDFKPLQPVVFSKEVEQEKLSGA